MHFIEPDDDAAARIPKEAIAYENAVFDDPGPIVSLQINIDMSDDWSCAAKLMFYFGREAARECVFVNLPDPLPAIAFRGLAIRLGKLIGGDSPASAWKNAIGVELSRRTRLEVECFEGHVRLTVEIGYHCQEFNVSYDAFEGTLTRRVEADVEDDESAVGDR